MTPGADALTLRVQAIRLEAETVRSFELRASDGRALPPFEAGAHLDIMLPDGTERSYSLVNAPSERHRYVVAVRRETESRGGSAFMSDVLRCGDSLTVRPPRNSFPLVETAPLSVFIAGGIGITPLLAMARRLEEIGRPWLMFFAFRTLADAPFLDELASLDAVQPGRVVLRPKDMGEGGFTVAAVLAEHPPGAHFYCCGPARMLQAFEQAGANLPPNQMHSEYFSAVEPAAAGGFDVVLARSGRTVYVPHDRTILETLIADGMNLPRSCMQGVCGTCETVVLEGTPDHRDHVLSAREKRSNRKMIICRSGCIGSRLVLDL